MPDSDPDNNMVIVPITTPARIEALIRCFESFHVYSMSPSPSFSPMRISAASPMLNAAKLKILKMELAA